MEQLPDTTINNKDVEELLNQLTDNMVLLLPHSCVLEAGLKPNINDKHQPKLLWIGRLRHLREYMRRRVQHQVAMPQESRRSFMQAALMATEARRTKAAETLVRLASLPDDRLLELGRVALALQRLRRRRHHSQLNDMSVLQAFQNCGMRGFVVFMCGSTGVAGDSLRYMRMLAGLGYLVVAPDDLAGSSRLRQRGVRQLVEQAEGTDYWQRNLLYTTSRAYGDLVYSSSVDSFLQDRDRFGALYATVVRIRHAELAYTLRHLPQYVKREGVTLVSMSEGSVVASAFDDAPFADVVRCRIFIAWSCERNYFNLDRPQSEIGIAGHKDIPTLNIIGTDDEFFGEQHSIAEAVAAAVPHHPPITGHALHTMVKQGVKFGLVAHLEGGRHNLTFSHDQVLRELMADFVRRPHLACRALPQLWQHSAPRAYRKVLASRTSGFGQVSYVRLKGTPQEEREVRDAAAAASSDVQQALRRISAALALMDLRHSFNRNAHNAGDISDDELPSSDDEEIPAARVLSAVGSTMLALPRFAESS